MATVELERCRFIWTISNFSFFPFTDAHYFNSPIFRLGKSKTRWEMCLLCASDSSLIVYLSRCDDDDGPRLIDVRYEMTVQNDQAEILTSSKYEETFEKLSSRGMDTPCVDTEEFVNSPCGVPGDKLIVICDLFLLVPTIPQKKSLYPPPAQALQLLSNDLKELYVAKKHSDVAIRTLNGDLQVHKCVLMARTECYKSDLKLKYTNVIEFPNVPKKAVEKLLWFMYSGEFEFLDSDGPIILPLVEMIRTFQIPYLKDLTEAKTISATTEFKLESSKFTWLIRDFSLYEKYAERPVTSPVFKNGEEMWVFTMFPNGFAKNSEFMALKVEATNVKRKIAVLLDVTVKSNVESEGSKLTRKQRSVRMLDTLLKDGDFLFPNILEKSFFECSLKSLAQYDSLTLEITLKVSPSLEMSIKSELMI